VEEKVTSLRVKYLGNPVTTNGVSVNGEKTQRKCIKHMVMRLST